jgi:hypothetical protein
MEPGYGFALHNRVRRSFPTSEETISEAWFAKPEDVIVGKLMAWQEGRSFKHESDFRDILLAVKYGDDPDLSESFKTSYVDRWVSRIGEEASALWQSLKEVTEIK